MQYDENRLIWLNGKILPVKDAKINVLTPTAQYGANVFEGIRCYWNNEHQQLYGFRLDDHYKRLKNSMKMFRMEDKYTIDELKQALIDVVNANGYKEDIAVRQTVYVDGNGSWFSKGPIGMFVSPIPKGRTLIPPKVGFKCCISSWERISDKSMSPKIKAGANYINSRMAQLEAIENGYDSAILMNNQGKISEGPGSCFFMVRDGALVTAPLNASILDSITRRAIIEIARSIMNIEVIERDIDRTELYICDEAFLCGSAVEVVPILGVDGIEINKAKSGPTTNKIFAIYLSLANGKIQEYNNYLTSIY